MVNDLVMLKFSWQKSRKIVGPTVKAAVILTTLRNVRS